MLARGSIGLVVALSLIAASLPAAAQNDETEVSDSARAAAQVLFDEGRALMDEEKFEQACAKFAESLRLDMAIGTQLNLANCYEKVGRTASAWIHFYEAGVRAKKEGQEARVKVAEERAAALKNRLSYLTIRVPFELEGLEIRRDGDVVGAAQWGTEVPIDPGEHRVVATAPGKKPFETGIEVTEEGSHLEVTIAPLEDAPVEEDKPKVIFTEKRDPTPQIAGGVVAGGLGLVGLGLGIGFGVVAKNKNDESKQHCLPDDENQCRAEGVVLRNDALTMSHVSTAGFVIAGAGIVTGIVLLATAPYGEDEADASARVVPWLDPGPDGIRSAGASVRVRW